MDQFSLTRQAIAFLGVVAVIAVVMILVFPVGTVLLGAIAIPALVFVWVKRGARTGKWFWRGEAPLTQVEGAIALSAAVLFVPGLSVVIYGAAMFATGEAPALTGLAWRALSVEKEGEPRRPVSSRSHHYSDPDTQQRVKDALAKAGIPYTVETKDGKEFVRWDYQHDAAAEEIARKARDIFDGRRNSSFPDAGLQKEFTDWLTKKGVAYETARSSGREYVLWPETAGDLSREFMEQRPTIPCGKTAAGKSRDVLPQC